MPAVSFITLLPLVVVGTSAAITCLAFSRDYSADLKKLSVLWITNFCFDLAGHIMAWNGLKNHWLYNIYFFILFVVLAHLYAEQIRSAAVKNSVRVFYVVFTALVIVEIALYGLTDLLPVMIVSGSMFMIWLGAAYFRQLYLSEQTTPVTLDPWFWFTVGFFIHFGGTMPFLGMLNYLWRSYENFTNFYYLYFSNSFTILLNILIAVGYLCREKYQK